MRAAGRDERMGSARGPNKRIRKKGRKKEEFEARFVLDIEIPIQGGSLGGLRHRGHQVLSQSGRT